MKKTEENPKNTTIENYEKFLGTLKVMVLPSLTFMMDPTMNLMSRPHYECERNEYHSPCFEVPKNYSKVRNK